MHIAMPASRVARWLRVALLLAAPALAAQPAATPESMVVAVTVNGEPRGDFFVFREGAGEFLFRRDDLAGIAKLPPQLVPVMVEGEACLRLSELPGARSSFNERTLALDITLPPEAFETQVLQIGLHAGRAGPGDAQATSGLFNYRVAYADNDAGISSWTLAAEEVVTTRGWLARNQSYHLMGDAGDSSVRYETQLIRDDRAALRRLTLGDAFTGADELGGAVPLGGVSLVKAYQLSPYFIRRPGTGFAGAVTLPSEVELYVGGTRLLRERVAPGPFEIENVHHYGGQRDVRVVVRDMFGREQETTFPFYFADQGLAAGLHDYSYHLGFLREDFGIESNDYGDAAVAAFHRYGIDDAWTVGVRGEATADYGNLGPSLVYRNDALGVVSAVAAASTDRVSGETGSALSLAHAWQARDFAVLSSVREFSSAYATLHTGLPLLLRQDLGLAVTYAPAGFGSLSLALRRARTADLPESRTATLSYSRPVLRWLNLLASYRADFSRDGADEVFVNLLFLPRGGHTASTFARRSDDGSHATGAQAGNTVPQGTGMAYRLSAQEQSDAMTSSRSVSPELDYYGRYGLLTLDAQQTEVAGQESSSYTVGLAGAVAAVGRRIDFSRPISDSFGLAEVTPAVGGVRVYQNGQEVGRTDDRGRVFLPQLTSFVDNSVTIDDRDIPIEYGVAATERIVAPAYRSGAVVSFAVTRTQAFTGVLVARDRGRSEPLAYHLVTLMDGSGLRFPTGSAGELYLENLAPGPHEAMVTLGASECRFTLTIPDSAEAMVELGEVVSCERRH